MTYNSNGDLTRWERGDLQITYGYTTRNNRSLLTRINNPVAESHSYTYEKHTVRFKSRSKAGHEKIIDVDVQLLIICSREYLGSRVVPEPPTR